STAALCVGRRPGLLSAPTRIAPLISRIPVTTRSVSPFFTPLVSSPSLATVLACRSNSYHSLEPPELRTSVKGELWWKRRDNKFNQGKKPFSPTVIETAVKEQNVSLLKRCLLENADLFKRGENMLTVC